MARISSIPTSPTYIIVITVDDKIFYVVKATNSMLTEGDVRTWFFDLRKQQWHQFASRPWPHLYHDHDRCHGPVMKALSSLRVLNNAK